MINFAQITSTLVIVQAVDKASICLLAREFDIISIPSEFDRLSSVLVNSCEHEFGRSYCHKPRKTFLVIDGGSC